MGIDDLPETSPRDPDALWGRIMLRWNRGERIQRKDIQHALDQAGDIPFYAKPLVKALLDREDALKPGPARGPSNQEWPWIVRHAERFAAAIAHYRKHGKHYAPLDKSLFPRERIEALAAASGTPLNLAADEVARQYDTTEEALLKQRARRKKSRSAVG